MPTGTTTINFGTGNNEASVDVTGQTAIVSGSYVEAFFMAEASGTHTLNDAAYAATFIGLSCGTISAGTGFTIYARSIEKMTGTFSIRWVWV